MSTWTPVSYTHLDVYKRQTQGTLEGRGEGVVRGYKYCFVFQAEDILPTLNELVNPYDQPLTEEDLDLPQAEYYWKDVYKRQSLWRAPGGVPAQPQARGAAYQAAPH